MKIAIVTNILTPYRIFLFDKLHQELLRDGDEFRVYAMCKSKSDRPWQYEQYKREYTEALPSYQINLKGFYLFFNKLGSINNYKPDIIVCAGSYFLPTVLGLLLTKRKYNRKVLFWSESHDKEQKKHGKGFIWLRNKIKTFSLSRFDGFLYASALAKEYVRKYADDNAKYLYFPNTIEQVAYNEAYAKKREFEDFVLNNSLLNTRKYTLFTPARLSPEKGIIEFLNILSKSPSCSNVTWIIAGDGPLKKQIEHISKEKGIDVRLVGQQTQHEIVGLLAIADCFVLPSFSDPNPLSVIEALWAGKPLLVSDGVGNQKEAIKNGINGYIFTHADESDAVEKIETMIHRDENWKNNAAITSLNIASEVYDIDKIVRAFACYIHSNF